MGDQLMFNRGTFNMKLILKTLVLFIIVQSVFGKPSKPGKPEKPEKPCEDKIDTCAADLAADATKCKKDKKFARDCQMTCDACKGGDKPGKPCEDKIDTCAADLAADATKCKKDKKF